jgi:hypothetical protein
MPACKECHRGKSVDDYPAHKQLLAERGRCCSHLCSSMHEGLLHPILMKKCMTTTPTRKDRGHDTTSDALINGGSALHREDDRKVDSHPDLKYYPNKQTFFVLHFWCSLLRAFPRDFLQEEKERCWYELESQGATD